MLAGLVGKVKVSSIDELGLELAVIWSSTVRVRRIRFSMARFVNLSRARDKQQFFTL